MLTVTNVLYTENKIISQMNNKQPIIKLTNGVLVVCLSSGSNTLTLGTTGLLVDQLHQTADVTHLDHWVIVLIIVDVSKYTKVSFNDENKIKYRNYLSRISTKMLGLHTEATFNARCMHSNTLSQSE